MRVIADITNVNFNHATFNRLLEEAGAKGSLKHLGKQCQYVYIYHYLEASSHQLSALSCRILLIAESFDTLTSW
jgi:hypothetical protein